MLLKLTGAHNTLMQGLQSQVFAVQRNHNSTCLFSSQLEKNISFCHHVLTVTNTLRLDICLFPLWPF